MDRTYQVPPDLREEIDRKRLVFTVTTGRSGTAYLAAMLGYVPGAFVCHEPTPNFVEAMRDSQTDLECAYRFWLDKKLPAIAREADPIYIETSHLFCKGFVEPFLEMNLSADLIVLRRSHRAVARSLCQLGDIPGRGENGLVFLLSPDDPGVLPLSGWQRLSDYQLAYWYCLEIERRSREYAEIFRQRGARVSEVALSEVATPGGYWRLLSELDLPKPGPLNWLRFMRNRKNRINVKGFRKEEFEIPEDLEQQEAEVRRRIRAQGVSV